jgi:hypothetical protein
MLAQSGALLGIPWQQARTRGRDRAQQDVAGQCLQVAKQLLSLIPCPHRAVLGAPPGTTNAPTAKQLPATTATPADGTLGTAFLDTSNSGTQGDTANAHRRIPRLARWPSRASAPACLRPLPPKWPASASELPPPSRRRAGNPSVRGTAPVAQSPWLFGRMSCTGGTCRQSSPTSEKWARQDSNLGPTDYESLQIRGRQALSARPQNPAELFPVAYARPV